MSMSEAELWDYIHNELEKTRGLFVPIKASGFERRFVKSLPCSSLHPNPDDEFCMESVGPSFRIIGEYEKRFRHDLELEINPFDEPLIVEKMRPNGYLLLNGHHRWAAAMNVGMKKVPVSIVNLTQEADIRRMLENSDRCRRATFDLDEVVFTDPAMPCEPFRRSLFTGRFKERLRPGIPALFHFFHTLDYDVWVFSSAYYSMEYIRKLLLLYSVHIDGLITGTARKTADAAAKKASIEGLIAKKYSETVNIDTHQVVRVLKDTKEFEQYELPQSYDTWSTSVMSAVKSFDRHEKH